MQHLYELRVEHFDGVARLSLSGEIDASQSEELLFDLWCCAGPHPIQLDLSGVTYFGATGARALVAARNHQLARGGSLALVRVSPIVRRVLGLLALTSIAEDACVGG